MGPTWNGKGQVLEGKNKKSNQRELQGHFSHYQNVLKYPKCCMSNLLIQNLRDEYFPTFEKEGQLGKVRCFCQSS